MGTVHHHGAGLLGFAHRKMMGIEFGTTLRAEKTGRFKGGTQTCAALREAAERAAEIAVEPTLSGRMKMEILLRFDCLVHMKDVKNSIAWFITSSTGTDEGRGYRPVIGSGSTLKFS
jgi:hypothetical protein